MLKRAVIIYTIFMLSFMLLFVRIIVINNTDYAAASKKQSTRTVTVGEKRGEIFDRNFSPLVNEEKRLLSVITPCAQVYNYLDTIELNDELRNKISDGYPFLLKTEKEINNELIRTFSVPIRYSESSLACHIVGYTDSKGTSGVSGIEKGYNEYLKENSGTLKVSFDVDALGRVLAGMDKTVTDNNFSSKAGVVLTIDKNIQRICENALKNSRIESGCAVVMHISSGEILALSSVPAFDRNNLAEYLSAENSPFVNKALQSYAAGSVFKAVVGAVAIENGYDYTLEYECTGEITVGDTVYTCFDKTCHEKVDMQKALEVSCNTYFINLIMQTDTDLLLSLCKSIGFSQSDTLCNGITTAKGCLPTKEQLKIKGELANFAFGQGSFLVTPIQMLKAYHTLATGCVVSPSLVLGLTNYMGLMTSAQKNESKKILSDETVALMREMLSSVVENGNAVKAKSEKISLAGKTGTAESGVFKDSKQLLRTWFAGFFPAQNPHYAIVILNENGSSGNSDCASVFKEICEKIVGYN